MKHYPFYVAEYAAATAHLSNEEDLAYRRLLDLLYETEQPISTETQQVARRLRLGTQQVLSVLQEFFLLTDAGWEHKRVNKELKKMSVRAQASRANGVMGGRKPKKKEPTSNLAGTYQEPSDNLVGTQQEPSSNLVGTQQDATRLDSAYNIYIDTVSSTTSTTQNRTRSSTLRKPDDVSDQVWSDWVAHRKAKKATVSATVLDSVRREAEKAGWTLQAALAESVARGWQGFKADWVAKQATGRSFGQVDYKAGVNDDGSL